MAQAEREAGVPLPTAAPHHFGHPPIRNCGSVCGSVAHADPAAEVPAALLALDGEVVRSVRGRRPTRSTRPVTRATRGGDRRSHPQTTTLAEYLIPRATDLPAIEIEHLGAPSEHGPAGIKGLAEGPASAAPAALVCAVLDAIGPQGTAIEELPLRPETIARALAQVTTYSTSICSPISARRSISLLRWSLPVGVRGRASTQYVSRGRR